MNCKSCGQKISTKLCEHCGQSLPEARNGLALPRDLKIPFFAYGVFKPGELAFLQIKQFVQNCIRKEIAGQVKIRDGLPIATFDLPNVIDGVLIYFRPESQAAAYQRIADLEPEKQFRWETRDVGDQKVNILAGVSPNKGAEYMEGRWNGKQDPLFTSALEVIEETLGQNQQFSWDLKPLFHLEMAYLLLWTSIERYASLRYHLRDKATQKVWKIASESAFGDALSRLVIDRRSVQRSDDPTERCDLDPKDPEKSIAYYYQIRSNLVHKGKGVVLDHERLMKSLKELLTIFRAMLDAAFAESQYPVDEA